VPQNSKRVRTSVTIFRSTVIFIPLLIRDFRIRPRCQWSPRSFAILHSLV